MEQISEHLYRYEDICNVYILKDGNRALLVDFGTGSILEHLGEIGVSEVDWLLHTHHHRDQCQGDFLANRAGIPIGVPVHERPYFDQVEVFWGSRPIYDAYDTRMSFFTLTQSVEVARSLMDYDVFRWGPYEFLIQPTPGHSVGHTSFLVEIDGKRVLFAGDLIAEPGKMHTLYDLQFTYNGSDGCEFEIYSLMVTRNQSIDLACPSHGDPFGNYADAAMALEGKLRAYLKHRWDIQTTAADVKPIVVSPHLLWIPGCSNTWVLRSDSGKALFVDYGSLSGTFLFSYQLSHEANNYFRMLAHNLDVLQSEYGITKIDVAIPSHYHDDHVNGLPFLQKHYGTEVWCYENMKDVLENPSGYKLGCTYPDPMKVSRAFGQGETFQWEEYEFEIYHAPGHADYHMAMFGMIDGELHGFSGDEVQFVGQKLGSNNIWLNHVHANSHEITGKLFLEKKPVVTLPGHGGAMRLSADQWRDFYDWCMTEQRFWRDLSAPKNLELAVFPDYVFLYPYQPKCAPGQSVEMQVWYENVFDATSTLEYELVLPPGWSANPSRGLLRVAPGDKGIAPFRLTLPSDQSLVYRRMPFTLDATIDGKRFGQLAEALVDMRPDWEPPFVV
jgi:glyoxylase-like metal-dependent hydrolase (beta-lactamase superfamily II)